MRELDRHALDVAKALRQTVVWVRRSAAQRGVIVEIHVASECSCECRVDEQATAQMLWHLLSELVDRTGAGGRARVEVASDEDDVVVTMTGETVQIPADLQSEELDEPLSSTQPWATRVEHSVGLALARHVAERHGGEVHAEVHERGPRLWVRIPKEPPAALE